MSCYCKYLQLIFNLLSNYTMPIFSSDSDEEIITATKLFGRERPIHDILGGGKVADVLLWRNAKVTGALLIGLTVIWLLFEVFEYNFVTLSCHISITTMLLVFIWCTGAEFFGWRYPETPDILLHDYAFKEAASIFHGRFIQFMSKFLNIACGRDPALFFVIIISLYALSVIGNCLSFLNLLYLSFFCMVTLPYLYDQYEDHVDHLAGKLNQEVKISLRKLDSKVLNKIPRGPVKEKKIR